MQERIIRFRVKTVLSVLGIFLAVFAFLQVLETSRQVLTWILISLFLALALNPLVEFLIRRGVRRRVVAIGLTYFLLIVAIVLIGSAFAPTLAREIREFVDAVPGFVDDLTAGQGRLGFLQRDYQIVERIEEAIGNVEASRVLGVSGTAVAVTRGVITVIVAVVTIAVLTFFMLLEGPRWIRRGLNLLSDESRPRWEKIGRDIYATVGGYVAGAVTIALLAGFTTAILLSVLSVAYAFALALLVALLDLIPLAGATIGAVVVSAVAFLDRGLTIGLIVVVWFVVYQQVENHVLYPLVYSRTVQLSPLAILIAVLIGASLAGVLGALAAIPVAGTIQVLLREWVEHRRADTRPMVDAPL